MSFFVFQPEEPIVSGSVMDSGTLGRASSGAGSVSGSSSSSGGGGGSSGGGIGDMMNEMQKKLAARRAKAENTGQVREVLFLLTGLHIILKVWEQS